MVEVGIRELKADLSGYLKRAAAGEAIRVTNHGKAFVDLVTAAPSEHRSTGEALDRLATLGVITRSTQPLNRAPRRVYKASGSLSDAIIEERDRERRR